MKRGFKTRASSQAVLSACAALLSVVAWAHLPIAPSPKSDDGVIRLDWTPVQIGVCSSYPFQFVSGEADVYGIAAGVFNLRQKSAVVSVAPVNAVYANYFAQGGLIDVCGINAAFEAGLLCLTGRNLGVSVGAFNVESNFGYRGKIDPYPWLPGLQVGLLNVGGGIQMGLLNYNPQGVVTWLPFINFPWEKDE